MTIIKRESLFDFDQDIVLPFTNEWKKTYNAVIKKIEENYLTAKQNKIILQNILSIIIKEGKAYEDVVLKATMLYFAIKNNIMHIDEVKLNYSSTIYSNIKILLDDNNINHIDQIFLNKEYAYLNKIKLAEYIVLLNNISDNKIVDKIKLLSQVDYIIKNHQSNTHKKLMQILIDVRNKVK